MSTDVKKKPGRGIYALPLLAALPTVLVMIAAVILYWPALHKLLSILIKLAVRA